MRVVHPEHGTRIAGGRTCPLRDIPSVGVRLSRRYQVIFFVCSRSAIVIEGSLGILGIGESVRMQTTKYLRMVDKHDFNRVSNLGADQRPEYPQMLPFRSSGP